ncbi:MAG: type II secretion system F family protein, partial [Candidatus Hydrogenedentes bacterium]|nr:type II secretion system F family protein [Candidatus Hydrogenedentota bacterium]
MPAFAYKAIDKKGNEMNGVVDAENETLAIAEVKNLGYFPLKIYESSKRAERRARKKKRGMSEFYIGGVKTKELVVFTRQLSTLIDAGLPLLRSLNILHAQLKPSKLRDIIEEMTEDIQAGTTFSEALAKHPKAFDRLYVNMVRAGEIGGMLEVVLNRLADYAEKRQALRRRVRGAMVYPVAVMVIAASVVGFLMVRVVPVFAEIYADFGSALPGPTQLLVKVSNFMVTSWWLLLVYISSTLVFFKIIFKIPAVQRLKDKVVLRLPLISGLVVKVAVARFSRTLGTLIASGVPILQALKIVKETISNTVIQNAMDHVHDSIKEGETIAAPLEESGVFPPMVVNMIDVGEETGSLDAMLMKVADTYDAEVEAAVGAMLTMMEPIMIVFLGV